MMNIPEWRCRNIWNQPAIRRSKKTGSNATSMLHKNDRVAVQRTWASSDNTTLRKSDKIQLWEPEYSTKTGRNRAWNEGLHEESEECVPVENAPEQVNIIFSQNQYKRLSEQVSNLSKQRLRGKGFQTFYCGDSGENVPLVCKSQLAWSLKAFRDKPWVPYRPERVEEASYVRCRPVSCIADSRRLSSRPPTATKQKRPRAKSAITLTTRRQHEQAAEYDTLTPQILHDLSAGTASISSPRYGDTAVAQSSFEIFAIEPSQESEGDKRNGGTDEGGVESGIESIRDSDESDDGGDEPSIDNSREAPMMNLYPERLDPVTLKEGRREPKKFDFDAANIDVPKFEYSYPLTGGFDRMDWKDLTETIMHQEANDKRDLKWQQMIKRRPKTTSEEAFITRLMQFERLTIETEDLEERRDKTRQYFNNRRNIPKWKSNRRDKNCCPSCVQPACAGDCPDKQLNPNLCLNCSQKYCDGICRDSLYDAHRRHEQVEEIFDKKRGQVRPKSCTSCRTKHAGKVMNANNIILGRPRSSHVTFSCARSSVKPRDLRPVSGSGVTSVAKEISKLGISHTRPTTSRTAKRYYGRNSLCPGKSYFSQRRNSLTGLIEARVKSAGPESRSTFKDFRAKKHKRPNTAA